MSVEQQKKITLIVLGLVLAILLSGCGSPSQPENGGNNSRIETGTVVFKNVNDTRFDYSKDEIPQNIVVEKHEENPPEKSENDPDPSQPLSDPQPSAPEPASTSVVVQDANIVADFRPSLDHGLKDASHQKYIVLHDTEVNAAPQSIINSWDNAGNFVAAHFVVGKDGSIWQCVDMDRIAHHAGFGNAGHNDLYGVFEDGRDDMRGTSPIGSWVPDYGMNAWSIGIEMVHVGGEGYYPEEQLEAVDALISHIDAHYGFQSAIIDHKAWRSGNSDTSPEFAGYLANYQNMRHH